MNIFIDDGGGGGGGGSTYQYWRIYVTANDGDGTYVSCSEIQFYESNDGTGTNRALASTFQTQSGDAVVGNANLAVDNNQDTETGSTISYPYTLTITLAASYTILSMGLISQRVVTGRTPTDFLIQGSPDNSTWYTIKTVTGSTGWGVKERRVFVF